MKKKFCISLLLIAILSCVLFACTPDKSVLDTLADEISYAQEGLYCGSNDNFSVSLSLIKKEDSFIADGVVGKLINENTLSVKPSKIDLLDKQYSYCLSGESGTLEGALLKDILGVTFSAMIENVKGIGSPLKLTITYDGVSEEIELTNQLEGAITYMKALECAYNNFKEEIDLAMLEKEFGREIYIKYVSDNYNDEKSNFWYVSFIKDRNNYFCALIDPKTGEIVAQR